MNNVNSDECILNLHKSFEKMRSQNVTATGQ